MLYLLTEVDRICKKHEIRYWLSSGTLIGAIRHNGFIPWDDDLDIEMMREDYLKLMAILPTELPEHIALQNHETDPSYFFCYAKIRDRRSFLNESNNYDRLWIERGIYIDIFPLEKQSLWIHRISEIALGHIYKIWRTSRNDANNLRKIRFIFQLNIKLLQPFLRLLNKLCSNKTLTSGLGIPFHNPRNEKDIFPLTTHIFEGNEFPVPYNSNKVLQKIYGDYMKLPDLNKLQPPHTRNITFYE